MRGAKIFGMLAAAVLATMIGCKGVKPILPRKKLPPGTFQMHFIRKIAGPVDLTINGVRIPIEQKKKKVQWLTVSGLSQGKHNYFITSHMEAIGPDYGDFEIGPDEGVFQVHFARKLKAAFYNTGGSVSPAAEGIPGVTAFMD
jgi:hypothetical protein